MKGVPHGAPFMIYGAVSQAMGRAAADPKKLSERFNVFGFSASYSVVLTVCLVLGHERRSSRGAFHDLRGTHRARTLPQVPAQFEGPREFHGTERIRIGAKSLK